MVVSYRLSIVTIALSVSAAICDWMSPTLKWTGGGSVSLWGLGHFVRQWIKVVNEYEYRHVMLYVSVADKFNFWRCINCSKVARYELNKIDLQHFKVRTQIAAISCTVRAARSPVFYGSSRISGHFSRLPFETKTGDTFSRISTTLNFVACFSSVANISAT